MSGWLRLRIFVSTLWAIAVAAFFWGDYPPYSTDAEVRRLLEQNYPESYAVLVDSASTVAAERSEDVPAGLSVDPTDDDIEGRLGAIRFLMGRDMDPAGSESLVGALEAIERQNVRSYLMTALLLWLGPVIAVFAFGAGVGWVQGFRNGERGR